MPPTSPKSRGRKSGVPFRRCKGRVAPETARALGDSPQVQVLALHAIEKHDARDRRQKCLGRPLGEDAGDPRRGHGRGERDRHPHHPVGEACPIVLEPDLDPGDHRSDPGEASQALLEAPMAHVLEESIDTDKTVTQPLALRGGANLGSEHQARISVILSRNNVLAMVAFRGWPAKNAFTKPLACSYSTLPGIGGSSGLTVTSTSAGPGKASAS